MAFGKITKQDLVEAGLDPDKIKEFQEKGVTKDDLTALKSELATSVTDLIKAQFTELEGKLKPQSVTKTENTDDPNKKKTQEELDAEQQAEFYANPTEFIKKSVGGVYGAAAVEFKRMSRDLAFKDASKELKGFSNPTLRAEIEEEWKKYTPEIMARNNTDPSLLIRQVHDMILGKHHDEIIQDRDKKDGKFNLVHSSSGSGGSGSVGDRSSTTDNKGELSVEEKALAKKFGMTEDEWKQQGVDMEKEEQDRHARLAGV